MSRTSTPVFLPEKLARRIAEYFPQLDLDTIQFRLCRRIPFSWLAGGKRFAGLTLWNRVYLLEDHWPPEPLTRVNVELIVHELAHVLQYRRNPLLFPLRYVIDHFRYGYESNPAEVEARETARSVAESFFRATRL